MKGVLTAAFAATALAVAACSEQHGAGRPLGLAAAVDSSGDSIPGRKPGPVASVTVSPESATVVVGDSAGFFADLRDAAGNPARDANVRWSVADPTVARIEGEFGQSVILRALRRGSTTVTARSHGKSGAALLVVDSLPPPPPPGDSVATVEVTPSADTVAAGDSASFFATLRDAIAFITINRPDKLNALNDQVVDELADAAERVATEDAIKGAILSGAGQKAFVAGADIADLAKQGPFDGKARALRGQAMLRRLETCGKPVIAAVNGYALGGGCELAMACHLRIASDAAKFGQPEVKLGIAPGYGGTQRLPRLVGKGNALRLILTGDMIDAQEAYRIGLVNQVVPAGDLLAAAEQTLRGILAMGPLAVRLALEAVDQGLEMTLDEGLLLEANHFGLLAATEDMKEGLTAFLEKRPPRFRGR